MSKKYVTNCFFEIRIIEFFGKNLMNFPITASQVIYTDLQKNIYYEMIYIWEFVILFGHKLAFKKSEDLFTEKFTCMYSKELPL